MCLASESYVLVSELAHAENCLRLVLMWFSSLGYGIAFQTYTLLRISDDDGFGCLLAV